jgi:hypothetical protein
VGGEALSSTARRRTANSSELVARRMVRFISGSLVVVGSIALEVMIGNRSHKFKYGVVLAAISWGYV